MGKEDGKVFVHISVSAINSLNTLNDFNMNSYIVANCAFYLFIYSKVLLVNTYLLHLRSSNVYKYYWFNFTEKNEANLYVDKLLKEAATIPVDSSTDYTVELPSYYDEKKFKRYAYMINFVTFYLFK